MSWIDKIKDSIIIICGDGKSYSPSWINASKQLEWNVAEFNFPGLDGTFVKKSKKLGTKYLLELFFQGSDHLDLSSAFELSANDPRPWVIQHPFYGILNVQAPSFLVDNTGLNVSKWTGIVIETILETNPITKVTAVDAITIQKELLDESFASALTAPLIQTDVQTIQAKNKNTFNLTVPIIKIPKQVESYFNLFNKASSAVNTATASPLLAMRTTIAMINAPAMLTLGITNRMNLLSNQFQVMRASITGLTRPGSKQIYQNMAGSVISTMCLATTFREPGDFANAKSVYQIVDVLLSDYNQFIADLDLMQTANGGNPNSFVPDANSLIRLNQLLNITLASLFSIALSSKNERSVITEADTNIIILTHRFYGLDADDANIDELILQNGIGLNGLLQIRKGTKIVYYI